MPDGYETQPKKMHDVSNKVNKTETEIKEQFENCQMCAIWTKKIPETKF